MAEPSSLLPWSDAAHAYAAPSFAAGRDWLDAVTDLMRRIHHEFEFDAETTTVTTSVDEVLAQRSGVCQDFAHVMLATCRSAGIPARYVSGYLYDPALGDNAASHAWVDVWDEAAGWTSLDPTHDREQSDVYVRVAVGRDYADVPPTRGVYKGVATETLSVRVALQALS